jgi:uncharacterized protein
VAETPFFDPAYLVKLANTAMPFGKYAGRLLIDLPEPYVIWLARSGYPKGELAGQLASVRSIKENGLEGLLRPLVGRRAPGGSTRREGS